MGEAKRRKKERAASPDADRYSGPIDLHILPSITAVNGARIREFGAQSFRGAADRSDRR